MREIFEQVRRRTGCVPPPIDALVARPSVPDALLTLATPTLEELQVAEVVRSWVELSVYVPVAENC